LREERLFLNKQFLVFVSSDTDGHILRSHLRRAGGQVSYNEFALITPAISPSQRRHPLRPPSIFPIAYHRSQQRRRGKRCWPACKKTSKKAMVRFSDAHYVWLG
jgi:hypothetical protein